MENTIDVILVNLEDEDLKWTNGFKAKIVYLAKVRANENRKSKSKIEIKSKTKRNKDSEPEKKKVQAKNKVSKKHLKNLYSKNNHHLEVSDNCPQE